MANMHKRKNTAILWDPVRNRYTLWDSLHVLVTSPRLQDQLAEECSDSDPGDTVPNAGGRLNTDDCLLTRRQTKGNYPIMQSSTEKKAHLLRELASKMMTHGDGSPSSSTYLQHNSRSGVSNTPIVNRGETGWSHIPGGNESLWPMQGGSLCIQAEQPASTVSWQPDPYAMATDGLPNPVEIFTGLCVSPLCTCREVP